MWLHPRAVRLLLSLLAMLGAVLPLRAQAVVPCATTPRMVKDIWQGSSSRPSQLVNVGGTLYFAARDSSTDVAVWKSDGTDAGTVPVRRFAPGPPSNVLSDFVAVGSRLFFTVQLGNGTRQLWKSDGTETSTEMLASFIDSSDFVALGDVLFFRASTLGSGSELWRSDGTLGGTRMVQEIGPSSQSAFPQWLTVLNGELFFSADDGTHGAELWKSDGAGTSATLVKDLWSNGSPSNPEYLRVMGGNLYFTANDGTGKGIGLWKSSGAVGDVQLVANDSLGTNHTGPMELTVAGNTLFFVLNDITHGWEPWRSDGTPEGTRLLKDINPTHYDSNPERLTAVGGLVFFTALEGSSGKEIWRSDGTEQGTFLVQDIVPSTSNPQVDSLEAGPGLLLAVLDDLGSGYELWKSDGRAATRMTDLTVQGSAALPPDSLTMVGTSLFFAADHPTLGRELFVLALNEVDCTSPTLTCPPSVRLEATSPQGVYFSAPPALASDDALSGLDVRVTPKTEGIFGLGPTPLTVTATDAAGNVGSCSFSVTVEDTTAPRLLCPAQVVLEATSPAGAVARYSVAASDAVYPQPLLTYEGASPGATVPTGTSLPVRVHASDTKQESTCTFTLTVRDTVAPKLTCPEDIVRVATSPEPVAITYAYSVEDAATAAPAVSTEYPSGSLFPVGVTPVTLTVEDASNNKSQCTFAVANLDPVAPEITCPGPQQAVASRPGGVAVSFPEAQARDNVGSPTVSYSPERGSTFPLGETTVTATANDLAGNASSCAFTVTVVEGTVEEPPPEKSCGCGAGSWSGGLGWLGLVLVPLWARRRTGRVAR